jgi:hypothetical protein
MSALDSAERESKYEAKNNFILINLKIFLFLKYVLQS